MSIKILSEASLVSWGSISANLCKQFEHLSGIFGPIAKDVSRTQVLELELPYGTPIIHDGHFCWESLPEKYATWRAEYGDTKIPLCLVTGGAVELHEVSPVGVGSHSIPISMLAKGALFGLFQTFCDNLPQPRLRATAGGTSLIFLPTIGNQEVLRKCVKKTFEKYGKTKWNNAWDVYQDPHLKSNDTSGFYFGQFFRDLLFQVPSKWRAKVILFPASMVDEIRKNDSAHLATVNLSNRQMRRSYERSKETADILSDDAVGNVGHVLALRMIARGLRPGFAPVFGTADDENVLPVKELHDLFYGKDAPFDKAAEFYPALFRPSLSGEAAFYFLNWPFVKFKESKKQTNEYVVKNSVAKSNAAEVGLHSRNEIIEKVDKADIAQKLKSIAPQNLDLAITFPEGDYKNYFLDGGIVLVRKPNGLS